MELNIHSECPKCGGLIILNEVQVTAGVKFAEVCPLCGWHNEPRTLASIYCATQDLLKALTAAKSREAKLEAERDWLIIELSKTSDCPGCMDATPCKHEQNPDGDCKACWQQAAANATEGK